MDNDKVVELLLDVKDRMVRVETKLDAYNGLNQKLNRIEERLLCVENAPAKQVSSKVSKFTDSIISAIGTIIGGGIVFLIASNIK
jgi:hypothetical protein